MGAGVGEGIPWQRFLVQKCPMQLSSIKRRSTVQTAGVWMTCHVAKLWRPDTARIHAEGGSCAGCWGKLPKHNVLYSVDYCT